jgi:penicillin-binding protein 1A
MARGRERREPVFEQPAAAERGFSRGLTEEDRPGPPRRRGGGTSHGGGRRPKRARPSLLRRLGYWSLILCLWGGIALAGLVAYHAMKLPPIDQLAVPKRPPNIAILGADGTLIANRGETGGSNVPIRELPPHLPKAFIAIEDRRFLQHYGIDPIGLARAMWRNVSAGRLSEGGSTLTQQLAKNIFLTQERTASRKIQEAILAIWLERNYSKDQILELYLNRVYFGSGAYGVEAAAQRYFGKSARAVTLAEAAILAGLVQAPSRLAPNRFPERAADRAALVIAAMAREGFVKEEGAKLALAAPARAKAALGVGSVNYAADWVMDVLDDYVGTVERDIVVTTTISPGLQAQAERALVAELDARGDKANVEQGAVVALAPDGAIRAMVGGRDYAQSQFNRATAARRQPGSAFKPFVYLAALEKGWTPDTPVLDAPIRIKGWQPENFTREYFGEVPLRKALALSLNTPVVRLIQEVGPRQVVRTAQRLGISSALNANASLALGTSEVTPLELTAAYAAFANGGTGIIPHIIAEVKTADGKMIYRRQSQALGRVAADAEVASMNQMLRETLLSGTARKAEIPGWPAAGKTGTTQEHKDAWFVGYTGHLVTAVWLGNDDGENTRKVTGSGLPVDVWNRFMREAHKGVPVVPLPGAGQRVPADNAPLVAQGAPRPPGNVASAARDAPPPPEEDPGRVILPTSNGRGLLDRLFGG